MISKPKPKSKKPLEQSDEISDESIKEFIKFFKIEIKSEKEVSDMTKQKKRQYECRLKRWESLIQSHIEFEIFKSLSMFKAFTEAIDKSKLQIAHKRADPEFDTKYDAKYKKSLTMKETEFNQMAKQLASDRQAFDDIYIPYKKRKAEEEFQMKEEVENSDADLKSDNESEIAIKEEYISEEDELDIKKEIKEEYFSEEDTIDSNADYYSVRDENSDDDKTYIKKEIKSEVDVKPHIKSEIKSEIKFEMDEHFKKEYISSDSDDE